MEYFELLASYYQGELKYLGMDLDNFYYHKSSEEENLLIVVDKMLKDVKSFNLKSKESKVEIKDGVVYEIYCDTDKILVKDVLKNEFITTYQKGKDEEYEGIVKDKFLVTNVKNQLEPDKSGFKVFDMKKNKSAFYSGSPKVFEDLIFFM